MREVYPAYYEIALKKKYSYDDESVKVLDMVVDNRVFDFGYVYDGWKGMSFPLTSIRTIHGLFSPIHPMEPASEQRIKRYRVVMCRMLPTYA